jgi:hypothetical protein
MYTAIVLSPESQAVLLEAVRDKIFQDEGEILDQTHSEIIAHHCTLKMGENDIKQTWAPVGTITSFDAVSLAYDEKVVAVGVKLPPTINTKNEQPHITIAVNREKGGKPFLSNKLDWSEAEPIDIEEHLVGTVEECN